MQIFHCAHCLYAIYTPTFIPIRITGFDSGNVIRLVTDFLVGFVNLLMWDLMKIAIVKSSSWNKIFGNLETDVSLFCHVLVSQN